MEGVNEMKAHREGKVTVRTFRLELAMNTRPANPNPDRGPVKAGQRRKPRLSSRENKTRQ
jgi:hypothetical protein